MVLLIFSISILLIGSCTARPDARIYGGFFAKDGQFPYQAAIYTNGVFGCGATIYNERFILTATHCIISDFTQEPYKPENLQIRVGSIDLNKNGTYYSVKKVINHTEYYDDRNDIALLELTKPIQFSKSVQPIELYNETFPSGSDVIISGWGLNEENYMLPFLKYHQLKAHTQPKCGEEVGDDYGGFICIEHTKDNGMCFGDSGGPAVANGKLIGIANIVIWECGTTKPDVYAYIPFYIDWIKKHTEQ